MTISALLAWVICGLIAGLIAHALLPGQQQLSLVLTMVLGILGGVAGGILYSLFVGSPSQPFSLSGNAWHGWLVAALGAIVALWAYATLYPRRWWE